MESRILNAFARARALPPLEERTAAPPRPSVEELTDFLNLPNENQTIIPEPPANLAPVKTKRSKKSVATTASQLQKKERITEEPKFNPDAKPPSQDEINLLSQTLRQWYGSFEAIEKAKQNIKEETARMKTLETMIVNMMRDHAIGALDMSSTGGRVLYKKDRRAVPVSKSQMLTILTDHQQSSDKALEIMQFIDKHKTIVWRETLSYEMIRPDETQE